MKSIAPIAAALTLALAGCGRTDEQLSKNVQERLESERTPAAQYEITTKDRIVTLSGVVDSEPDRDRLVDGARSVRGVLGVDNRLTLRAPVQVTGAAGDIAFNPEDRAIKDAIRQKLNEMGASNVWLDVRDGIVTMQGEIPRDKHGAVVREAQGASPAIKRIDDLLVIR